MKINAYVLAADPAWIEASILSYYDYVDRIVVSYDERGLGWTGAAIRVSDCLERLKAIDRRNKMDFLAGHYSRVECDPMENDTYQRQCALDAAGCDADWVLQLDTDEVLPNPLRLIDEIDGLKADYHAVDWPMRTLFQKAQDGRFLEVCSLMRRTISSYPGPIAVKGGIQLKHARQTGQISTWRCDVRKRDTDPAAGNRKVNRVIEQDDAIWHFSWIRNEEEIVQKVTAWGHSKHFDGAEYIDRVWKAAPTRWPFLYRFHPLAPKWWPALRPVDLSTLLPGCGGLGASV